MVVEEKTDKQVEAAIFSCRRPVAYAVVFLAVFTVAHLCGFREFTNVLSGTDTYNRWQQFGGSLYLIGYFGSVVAAPVLLLATALIKLGKLAVSYKSDTGDIEEPGELET